MVLARRLLTVAVAVMFCLFVPPDGTAEAYKSVFSGSPPVKFMEVHRSKSHAETRISVMAQYFRMKNPSLSARAAADYAALVDAAAGHYDIDPFVVSSIIVKESAVRVKARGGAAYGLMQVNWKANRSWIPRVFPSVNSAEKLLHSKHNIYVGAYILKDAIRRSGGNVDKALDIYRGKNIHSYRSSLHGLYSEQVGLFRKKTNR